MIRAGIAGAAGYAGGELLRLLLRHPFVEIVYVDSNSQAGKPVSSVHEDLYGETDMVFSKSGDDDIDVLFLCMGHGKAAWALENKDLPKTTCVIDLSQDFRLPANNRWRDRRFVYGLPEWNREALKLAHNVANPGCFATVLALSLLPLVADGFNGNIYTTGITGATGAGHGWSETSHFSWRSNNIQAYKSLRHQHVAEVTETLALAARSGKKASLCFVPWRGGFSRGIFVSHQLETPIPLQRLQDIYSAYYGSHPFTHIGEGAIHLKQVVHTNKCLIQLEQVDGRTVIHGAIDNLLKGAAGQGVQNMNLMFGLDEMAGLDLKGGHF